MGDYYFFVFDDEGRVFFFGDNIVGQFGFKIDFIVIYIDIFFLLFVNQFYVGINFKFKVIFIVVGGFSSFFIVDVIKV